MILKIANLRSNYPENLKPFIPRDLVRETPPMRSLRFGGVRSNSWGAGNQ